MSRRGREGAPSDDVLLQALDRLVEVEGIVKAADVLGVTYRTATNCYESRHVSRKMRGVLEKHLREQAEQSMEQEDRAATVRDERTANKPRGGEEPGLQESEEELRSEVEALRAEVGSLRARLEAVEGRVSQGWGGGDDGINTEAVETVDADDERGRRRSVAPPRRVFPELITDEPEPGEEQVHGAATEVIVEWRGAWTERKRAAYTLDWLRAERRRLRLELRLIGEFGLTPPPADVPWSERRRDRELDWRRRARRRLRWQLPLTWCLHWLLRAITLGLWGRTRPS